MGVNVVAELPAIPQELTREPNGERFKMRGRRPDGAPCCMRVMMMERGADRDQARIRLEFGGGSVTYGHPALRSALTEHYQGHRAILRLSPRSDVRYRVYDDHVKQEIWLHDDPGTNVFEEVVHLENLTLAGEGDRWTFNGSDGLPVGSIPPLVVRAINVQAGTLLSTTAVLDVRPREDGSYLLRITVDPTWLAERFAAGDVVVIDPTTVATSTYSAATASANQRKIARFSNGVLFGMFYDGTNMVCRYSSDGGSTWQSPGAGATVAAVVDASVYIDANDYLHVAYGSSGNVYYKRGIPDAGRTTYTWTGTSQASYNGYDDYPDIVAHAEGTGWKAHIVYSYLSGATNQTGYARMDITSGGTVNVDTGSWIGSGYSGGGQTHPSISVDSSKNLFVAWQTGNTGTGNGVRAAKAPYSAGSWTWGSEEAVDTAYYAAYDRVICSTLDSQGRMILAYAINSGTYIHVQRRSAGGTWSDLSYPSETAGDSVSVVCSGDDIYVFSIDSGVQPRYRKYPSATSVWSSAVQIDSVTTGANITARREAAGSAIDALYTTGAGSPYNVVHYRLSLNQTPSEPTITVAAAFDATDGVAITITHNDPDASDTMSAYSLKRVNGGTTKYWDDATDAWVDAETYNTASGTSVTIAAADNAGDWSNNTTYQLSASTRDAGGLTSPYNSTSTSVKASAKPTVTITTPAAAGTVTGSSLTAVWTVSDPEGLGQSKYKVRLLDSAGTAELWTSGEVVDSAARSRTVVYTLVNSTTYKCEVTAWDAEGVSSVAVIHTFSTSFTVPATPTLIDEPSAVDATITLTATNPAPTGAQPTVTSVRFERTTDSGTTVVTIGTPAPSSGVAELTDYSAAGGVDYSYRAVAIGDNGTETAGAWVPTTLTFAHWRFIPTAGTTPVTFAYHVRVSWRMEEDVQVPPTRGQYRRQYRGSTFLHLADVTAVLAVMDDLTAREWRERIETLISTGTVGYLKSPAGDVWKGVLGAPAGEPDLARSWESVRLTFRQTGGAP